ncbi:MAG: glycosyltransferase family 2 protein [Candidatus Euphemobacter frigidus]|nr:glycosyltransferase family 2 protein [Candidatus Euphemobacter frigidus]MDP8275478.1 glycosyltransferase family 2 protein [Candidatus Euphemobacter frigidus]
MEKVSGVVTCFNRENEIERCLQSIRWVDELIVIDSFSTDRTVELAKPYADIFLQHEYISDTSQRHRAISHASHPWILIIDSDEVMPKELCDEIREELKNPRYGRYRVFRRGFFLGREMKHGGWNRDQNNILFLKDTYRFSDVEIHPILLPDDRAGVFKHRLDHYTLHTIDEFIVNSRKYATQGAQRYLRQGRKGHASNILLHPLFNFFKNYILRIGFLDGAHGLISAVLSSCYVAQKHAKLWELKRQKKNLK